MTFYEITIQTTPEGIELLSDRLQELGIGGFVVRDPEDFRQFLQGAQTHWDYVEEELMGLLEQQPSLTFYVADNEQGASQLEQTSALLEQLRTQQGDRYGSLQLQVGSVAEEDWENNWKQYFRTFDIGERLTIKPSWERAEQREGRIILEIDPASSFGTGTHHTTQLCLLQLEQMPVQGARVLDMGCGSGILGIAALLLGADHVTAVDIDENAVRVAGENAAQNSIPEARFTLLCGDVTGNTALADRVGGDYDLVLANIVADVLIGMRHELHGFLKPGGQIVVSGILTSRADEVAEHLERAGLRELRRQDQQDWVAIVLERAK